MYAIRSYYETYWAIVCGRPQETEGTLVVITSYSIHYTKLYEDLKHYWLQTAKIFEKQPLTGSYVKAPLKGLLEPGKSFVFMIPTIVGDKDAYGKLIYKNSNYGNRELLERANMVFRQTFDYFISYSNYSLWYAQDSLETIAKAIDVWNEPRLQPIAGVAGANPATARIYVRKSQVKKGNIDWTQSRGTDIADAEWLPIPNNMIVITSYSIHYTKLYEARPA